MIALDKVADCLLMKDFLQADDVGIHAKKLFGKPSEFVLVLAFGVFAPAIISDPWQDEVFHIERRDAKVAAVFTFFLCWFNF